MADHIEVREKKDGSWEIWYPDVAWIPCESDCDLKHKHDVERPHRLSFYKPTSYEDALDYLSDENREIKTIRQSDRQGGKSEGKKNTKRGKSA